MDHIYPGASDKDNQDQVSEKDTRIGPRHKEEGKKRRELDADDKRRILLELSNVSHPHETLSPHLYNIANGGIAPPEAEVNVSESVAIGQRMVGEFQASLPTGFHATISCPIKTMEHLKKRSDNWGQDNL